MPDPRFFLSKGPLAIGDALRIAGAAAFAGMDLAARVKRVAALDESDLDCAVIFIDDPRKAGQLNGKRFGLCLATREGARLIAGGPVAATDNPRAAFGALAESLHELRPLGGGKPATIDETANVHPTAILGAGAAIGAHAEIGPFVVLGPGVVIGERTIVAERVSIWCALIGAGVRIGPGSAIGGPGFGFAAGASGLRRIPQLGAVVISDNVEIGANVSIDRGALGDTTIGAGTKIDNLVQIAHNVRIGRDCAIAALVGIAGSARVGDRVLFGGQAAIADHLTIGDDARIAGGAGVMRDVPAGETWGGYPARLRMTWMRETAVAARAAQRRRKAADDGD